MCSFVFCLLFVDFEQTGTRSTAAEEQEGWSRLGDPYSRLRTLSRSKRLQVGWSWGGLSWKAECGDAYFCPSSFAVWDFTECFLYVFVHIAHVEA
jgi:hypothetical protein